MLFCGHYSCTFNFQIIELYTQCLLCKEVHHCNDQYILNGKLLWPKWYRGDLLEKQQEVQINQIRITNEA